MNVLSCFDGMSCGQIALHRVGIAYDNYYASEIDKAAIAVTQHNFPNTIQIGSVVDIRSEDLPKIDLLIGGSPCQGFSFSGKQLNFEDPRSKLFFEFVRLHKELKPKHFLLENVVMKQDYQNNITEALGVKPVEINSKYFVPQNRPRLYWTNIPIAPTPTTYSHCIADILETDVDESYFLTDKQLVHLDLNYKWVENEIIRHKAGKHQQDNIYRYDGIACCLTASCHGAARHLTKTCLPDGRVRRLTEREVEKLQGIPIDYTKSASSSKRYEMIGNGWTVDVIAHILKVLT